MWTWLVDRLGLEQACGAGAAPARVSVSDILNRARADEVPEGALGRFWQWATDQEPTFSIDRIAEACPAMVPNRLGIENAITQSARYWNQYTEWLEDAVAPFRAVLEASQAVFTGTPALLMVALVVAITLALTYKRGLALGVFVALMALQFFGLWTFAMETLGLIFVATLICMLIGIPVGIAMSRSDRVQQAIVPILDFLQTMPSFVYLIPFLMIFGPDPVTPAFAVILYAIPPVIRLTDLGIRLVDREVLEASEAFGASPWQKLMGVQIPLAIPTISAGINQTIMMSLAMVVIASIVNAPGLGRLVLQGVNNAWVGPGLTGGLGIVVLAIVLDRITRGTVQKRSAQLQQH